jgi:hypothetical protein
MTFMVIYKTGGDLCTDGRIILKWISEKKSGSYGLDSAGSG